MNNRMTNKSKLLLDGTQLFPYWVIGLSLDSQSPQWAYKETIVPHLVATLIYLSQIYSYHIRGDMSPLT